MMEENQEGEVRELTEQELKEAQFQEFLSATKDRMDRYFAELGYVCFLFSKKGHKGQSVYITNSPLEVPAIVEPYANASNIVEAKNRKSNLKKLRRLK